MTNDPATRLLRKVRLARLGLAFERLWGAAFPAVMTFGLALLFVVSGASRLVPVALRLGILALAAILFVGFAFRLLGCPCRARGGRWPGSSATIVSSTVRRRPGSTPWRLAAVPTAGRCGSPTGPAQAELEALQSHLPRSPLPARDPMALRNGLALGLVAALFLNAGDWRDRVAGL
jgi:hypothetical protein